MYVRFAIFILLWKYSFCTLTFFNDVIHRELCTQNFHHTFLSTYKSQSLHIWYTALASSILKSEQLEDYSLQFHNILSYIQITKLISSHFSVTSFLVYSIAKWSWIMLTNSDTVLPLCILLFLSHQSQQYKSLSLHIF